MSVGFGKRLREMREKKGLTQAELAKIASLGESTISFYESGKREPNYEVLVALADILDTTPNYLITGKNEWWEKDETPSDIDLEDFIKNNSNIKLMGNPLDEKAKEDVLMFLRAAHQMIKEKRKNEAEKENK
jgi:transcriptional regulator with XRE-family HTH domain